LQPADRKFHAPTTVESLFLELVTLGYPELQSQIRSCEVSDYDDAGYCDVRVLSGPRSPKKNSMLDGPVLMDSRPFPDIDFLLWTDEDGYLRTIEVVAYGSSVANIYERVIDAANRRQLSHRFTS